MRCQRSVYVRKTANPRTHANFGCDTDGAEHHRPRELEVGIEKAEPLLDAEHGLVLRRAGLPDGEEAFVREVEEIVYAQAVPLETFASSPARGSVGARVRRAAGDHRRCYGCAHVVACVQARPGPAAGIRLAKPEV